MGINTYEDILATEGSGHIPSVGEQKTLLCIVNILVLYKTIRAVRPLPEVT